MKFRKRIKIAPGIHINISKSGISTTIGPKGANVNVGKDGAYLNTGVPGTGLYDRKKIGKCPKDNVQNVTSSRSTFVGCLFGIVEVPFLFFGVSFLFNGDFLYSIICFLVFGVLVYIHCKIMS